MRSVSFSLKSLSVLEAFYFFLKSVESLKRNETFGNFRFNFVGGFVDFLFV